MQVLNSRVSKAKLVLAFLRSRVESPRAQGSGLECARIRPISLERALVAWCPQRLAVDSQKMFEALADGAGPGVGMMR
jgi:hypothetical protein